MLRPIYYDTETTGVKPDKDRIIEIAAYDPYENRTFEMLVNPGIPIPPEATAIHKITNEMVASAQTFAHVGQQFDEFCSGNVVLIAHNNDTFDQLFLKHEYSRHGLEMPQWKFIDSLKWSRRYRNDLPRHTLQFLREVYNISENNAHRALDDVVVLEKVFANMVDDLTMDQIYQLLNKQRLIQHMPFGKHQGTPLKQLPKSYVQWLQGSGAFDKPENNDLVTALRHFGLLELTPANV